MKSLNAKRGANHDVATAIDGRCMVLSNMARVTADHTFFAQVELDCDAGDKDSADEAEDQPITQATQEHKGWRLSYRKIQPEIVLSQRIRAHLEKKTRAWESIKASFETRRARSKEVAQAAAELRSSRKKLREKQMTASLKAARAVVAEIERGLGLRHELPPLCPLVVVGGASSSSS